MAGPDTPAPGEATIIHLPNVLRLKVGPRFGSLSQVKLRKAETSLKHMSGQLERWMDAELEKLTAAQAMLKRSGMTDQVVERLYDLAKELRGLSVNYEFPIVSRLAGSLVTLIEGRDQHRGSPRSLLDAHVEAIKACVRDRIRTAEHPVGKTLAETLEQQVAALRS